MTRILIVDDHPDLAAALRAVCATTSDLVVCGVAESGEGGLVLAVSLDPDVVLMDRSMPGMGGSEATRAIKHAGLRCRVLMLSGSWTRDQALAASEAGADSIVLKDGRVGELLTAVRALARETPEGLQDVVVQ